MISSTLGEERERPLMGVVPLYQLDKCDAGCITCIMRHSLSLTWSQNYRIITDKRDAFEEDRGAQLITRAAGRLIVLIAIDRG